MAEGRKGFSRRQMLGAGAAAGVAAALGHSGGVAEAAQAAAPAPAGAAAAAGEELVFVNGRIHTIDRKSTRLNSSH